MVFHGFAPTDALDEKVRFTDDQINAFSKAFLGLTVSCARCHDHKFDAISQRDYYALFGILGSCRPARAVIDVPSAQNRNRELLAAQKHSIRQALATDWLAAADGLGKRLLSSDALWKDAVDESFVLHPFHDLRKNATADNQVAAAWQKRVDAWKQLQQPASLETVSASNETRSWQLGDHADCAEWFPKGLGLANSPQPPGTFAVAPDGDVAVTGIYPAGVYSHEISSKHPARLTSADLRLDQDYELWVRALGDGAASLRYVVQNYPRNGTVYPVTNLKNVWDWHRFDLTYWTGDQIHIELASGPDAPLLVNDQPRSWFGVREAMLLAKGQARPVDRREFLEPLFTAVGKESLQSTQQLAACYETAMTSCLIAWRDGNCTDAQAVFLSTCLAQGLLSNRLDDLPSTKPLIEVYRRLEHEIPVPTRVPGLDETIGRDQPLMERGNHLQLGEPVPRRFLEAIDATPYNTPLSGRAQLAEDLLRDDNPLTRRVIVNRIWHHLFGRGIVATPDNFGRLGELPTHPELLDWLAAQFPREDWSLKRLIRLIVTSQTWQLDSRSSERAREVDPSNRYLSHASVRRLEAEAIRDAILQVAGDLDLRPFGPPVGGNAFRRSVYVQVQRNSLDPFLRAFDFPEPFSATGRRDATNVPAQSLTLMNDPQIAAYANAWARRILTNVELATDEDRIQAMFHGALSRPATPEELSAARGYLAECRSRYQQLQTALVDLQDQVKSQRDLVTRIMEPARQKLLTSAGSKPDLAIKPPGPIGRWEFEGDLKDSLGPLHGTQHAKARVENGNLVLDGGSYVTTEPLQQSIRGKTLEVWVQLGNLDQRGGGVMTIQSADGQVFDAIVFGEQQPRKWLAGSNVFARTEPFQGPDEVEAHDRVVHFAIVYHEDGRIAGYRDGQPYGQPYQSSGLQEFAAGQTVIGFGIRHLPAGGNRLLTGRIQLAQLYDRPLSAEEVQASYNAAPFYVSDQRVLESLSESQRQAVQAAMLAADDLQLQIDSLGPMPDGIDKELLWTDMARAMFTLQEFIYIR